jgi:uncharacterized membrane protein YvlD (DUF360 family)
MPVLRIVNQLLVALSITLLSLVVLDALLPGFSLQNARSALVGILVLGALNFAILPVAIRITLPFDFLTLGVLPLVLNGLAVLVVSMLVKGFEVHNVITGILISFGLAFNNMLITSSYVFRKQRDEMQYSELARLSPKNDGVETTPGFIMLEIDGLAEPVLRQAIEQGYMPTLAAWLKSGTHRLVCWETSLPSQTSSMQAGILHGSHYNIPAFRFYDRQRNRVLVSNNPNYAPDILKPILNGKGLLREHGYSLNNWATGDAEQIILTFTALEEDVVKQSKQLYAFFARAFIMQQMLMSMVGDVIIEMMEAWRQKIHNVQPRIERRFPYPLVRSVTTRLLPYLNSQLIVSKLFEGIDSSYVTFLNYDEVAHHSGIDRAETFQILRQMDDTIRFITGANRHLKRSYEFVILSDHGQSMGTTFRQRYGETLAQLVATLVGDDKKSAKGSGTSSEGIDYISMLLSALVASSKWTSGIVNRLLRGQISDNGKVELRVEYKSTNGKDSKPSLKSAVCASGNLAHVYFTEHNNGMTMEEINSAYPEVMKTLVNHPGISFAAMRSEQHGAVAIGKRGMYVLETNEVQGENPLRDFGEHAPEHVKTLMTYPNSGDIVVNSLYNTQTGEVAAFEELVGSHGGLGGTQNQPFLLYPASLGAVEPDQLVGAPSIYELVGEWQRKLKVASYKATELPVTPPGVESGQRSRNISIIAILMAVIGGWNVMVGLGGFISRYTGPQSESFSHTLVPLLAAVMSVAIGVGLWRLKGWALETAIALSAVTIILSVLDLMLAPPQSRGLSVILASVPMFNALVLGYFLYSNQIRRAFARE